MRERVLRVIGLLEASDLARFDVIQESLQELRGSLLTMESGKSVSEVEIKKQLEAIEKFNVGLSAFLEDVYTLQSTIHNEPVESEAVASA